MNKFTIGDITITNEDNMELMARYPDKYFDLCITSPPYNLGDKHHTGGKVFTPYPDSLPEHEYQTKQIDFLNELYRVMSDNCSVFYNHKNRIKDGLQISPLDWLLKTNWVIKQEIVWINGSQNFDKVRFYPFTERVYWLSKGKETLFKNETGLSDVNKWSPEGTSKKHKRAFPLKMVTDILKCFPSGLKVIEPYLGSGTVAIACQNLGFNLVSCEIDHEYYNYSCERLKQHTSQLTIFNQ